MRMRRARSPLAVRCAIATMERVTHGLPADTRDRYADQVRADMDGLPFVAAWRHAGGVLRSAPRLRSTLTEGAWITNTDGPRSFGCATNLRHRWRWFSADDGFRFRACERCGKEHPRGRNGPGDWVAGGFDGFRGG